MPFALILLGLALVIASIRGTHRELGSLLRDDFSGKDNFLVWGIVIGALGVIGYNQRAQTFSRAFMSLVLVAMILSNGGVFQKFLEAFSSLEGGEAPGSGAAGNTIGNAAPQASGGGGSSDSGSGSIGSQIDGALGAANAAANLVKNPASVVKTVLRSIPFVGGLF